MKLPVILLFTIGCASAILNETTVTTGSISEHIGQLQFIRGKLVIDIDLTPPESLMKTLDDYTVMLKEIQQVLQERFITTALKIVMGEKTEGISLADHLTKRLEEKIAMVMNEVNQLRKTRWMNESRRVKRGLINAGGELLKGLFGTATDNEVQVVKKEVSAFISDAKVMKKGYQGILTDINTNHELIVKINRNLRKLISNAKSSQVNYILSEVSVFLSEVTDFIEKLVKINEVIEELSFHKYRGTFNKKNFPFIDYETLKQYDEEVTTKYGMYSSIPLSVDTHDQYLAQAILVDYFYRRPNVVRLIIPYVESKHFDLWKIHSFPTMRDDQLGRSILRLKAPYAIISDDRQIVLTFGERTFKYCKSPKDNYFACFPVILMKPTNRSICAASILRQEEVVRCNLEKFHGRYPVIQWIADERFLSLEKKEKVIVMCEDKKPQEKWLGLVTKLAMQCEVKSENLHIPGMMTLHKQIPYEFPVSNMSVPNVTVIPQEFEPEGPYDWVDPKWLNMTSPTFSFTPRDTYYHGMLATIWLVIVIMIICLARKKIIECLSACYPRTYVYRVTETERPAPTLRSEQNDEPPAYATVNRPPRAVVRTQRVHYTVQGDNGSEVISVDEPINDDEPGPN